IGPALMIAPPAPTTPFLAFTQKAAQTHPDPGIQIRKGRVVAMFEIAKPAAVNRVDARDDDLQALPIAALGQNANLVPQLLQAPTSSWLPALLDADRLQSVPALLHPRLALSPAQARAQTESCRSSFSGPHQLPSDSLASADS